MNPHNSPTMPELRVRNSTPDMELRELTEAAKKKKLKQFKQYQVSSRSSRATPEVQHMWVIRV